MKFTCSVIINRPRDLVVQLFEDPQYLDSYQDGFIRKELLSGVAQQAGSVSNMYYSMGKRGEMELRETIIENQLPDYFLAEYFHIHTENTMKAVFTELDSNTTQYEAIIEYTAFKGWMVKIISFVYPSMFKKQVEKWLVNFKSFAEQFNIN